MRPFSVSQRLLPLLLGCLLACEATPGGVHVVVEGPLVPGTDFDRLSVVAGVPATGEPLAVATLEGPELRLPATFNFESGPATPAGTRVRVRATAERLGEVRSTASGEATLTAERGARLTLVLPPLAARPDAGLAVEVCDNGVDDDGDGLSDCADAACEGLGCHPGGLTCGGGVCGCAGRPAGVPVVRPGFARRTEPVALVPGEGPLAGTLVVAGGRDSLGQPSAALDVFFLESSRLSQRTLAVGRTEASALALADGGVVVLGGVRAPEAPEPSLEWLAADGGTARVPFSPGLTARGALVGRLGEEVLLVGGALAPAQEGGAEQRNLAVRVRPDTGDQRVLGRLSLTCPSGGAPLGESFLLAGGCPGTGATARTDLIGPTGTLGVGPALPVTLEGPAVVALSGGRALVLGGREPGTGGGLVPSSRVFLFELSGPVVRVRELLPMDTPRSAPRAARAGNGWLYVEDAAGAPPAWFDPAAERFLPATSWPGGRREHALAGGAGAQVHAAGGTTSGGGLEDTTLSLELRCL